MKEKKETQGLTVKKEENTPGWYEQVCLKAELADFSPVKGCMIIRPRGYALWKKIENYFDKNINEPTGVKNAYFPIFIPEKFFKKEAEHAKGFSPEVAWIDKEITGAGERLALRPTSETIIYDSYSKWIRSYKDLPLKINQWCNIIRWETEATKLFLRSREFLWQEGHCVYETEAECEKETINYIKLYSKLCEELLAIPTLVGEKTEKEKFAGAEKTYTIEAFMPDGKSLQMGTSHKLGQSFAKAFGINFLGRDEKKHLPWQNSWGLSTRLIGAIVMIHSDNKGLVLPPKIASTQVVIVPIIFEKSKKEVMSKANEIKKLLKDYSVELDDREDYSAGWKFNEHELFGVPLRIEIGPKDIEKDQVIIVRRDNGIKKVIKTNQIKETVKALLETIQGSLLTKAKKHLTESIIEVSTWDELKEGIKNRKLVLAPFCGTTECEDIIKDETGGASSRCIANEQEHLKGKDCIKCNKKAKYKVYFSKSY